MKLILLIIWRLILYSFLLVGGLSLYTFLIYTHPPRHTTGLKPDDLGMTYEDIAFYTKDGIKLAGWFIRAQNKNNKAIVVCHGYPADKGDVLFLAKFLHENFHLLLFDFRAMGESRGSMTTCGWKERLDVQAAVDYLKSKGIERIGALGFSMGGAALIMASSPDVDAIVTDSAYAGLEDMLHIVYRNFGAMRYPFIYATRLWSRIFMGTDLAQVSPKDYIGRIKVPILLIHSESDSQIPSGQAYLLKEANPNADLWIIESAEHGEALSLRQSEYRNRVLRHFSVL